MERVSFITTEEADDLIVALPSKTPNPMR